MTARVWRPEWLAVVGVVVLCTAEVWAGAEAPPDTTSRSDSTAIRPDSTGAQTNSRAAPPDSAGARAKRTPARVDSVRAAGVAQETMPARAAFRTSFADTLAGRAFRSRHAFSLDHFLEFWPEFAMGRRGPIGGDAEFSRYGIGKGRGVLYLGSVPFNDPQDDRIPLALVPTTAIGDVVGGEVHGPFLPDRANIEGAYRIAEPKFPTDRPVVAIELTRGDRGLRQRRARFSTVSGPIGIDFELDELTDEGYSFDARGGTQGAGYGGSTTRMQGGNIRGTLPGGANYLFSFRRFTSVFNGDLLSSDSEQRRDGHLAVMRATIDRLDLSVFERSHEVSVPDSATSNNTAGVYASVPLALGDDMGVTIGAGYEDIHSRQRMGEEETRPRLQKGHLGVSASVALPASAVAVLEANATHAFEMSTGWGAGVTVGRRWNASNEAAVSLKRRFRMSEPFGELYQPRHAVALDPSIELAGNRYVEPEAAFEASAQWIARAGGFSNTIRVTAMPCAEPHRLQCLTGGGESIYGAERRYGGFRPRRGQSRIPAYARGHARRARGVRRIHAEREGSILFVGAGVSRNGVRGGRERFLRKDERLSTQRRVSTRWRANGGLRRAYRAVRRGQSQADGALDRRSSLRAVAQRDGREIHDGVALPDDAEDVRLRRGVDDLRLARRASRGADSYWVDGRWMGDDATNRWRADSLLSGRCSQDR